MSFRSRQHRLMGKAPQSYSIKELESILEYYAQEVPEHALTKPELIERVTLLAESYGLGPADRRIAIQDIDALGYRDLRFQREKLEAALSRINEILGPRRRRTNVRSAQPRRSLWNRDQDGFLGDQLVPRNTSPEVAMEAQPTTPPCTEQPQLRITDPQPATPPCTEQPQIRITIPQPATPPCTEQPQQLCATESQNTKCEICDVSIGSSTPLTLEGCTHELQFCCSCLEQHIANRFGSFGYIAVPCPSCGSPLTYQDIMKFAGPDYASQYEAYMTLRALKEDPHFCECAAEDCRSGQDHLPANNEDVVMECERCGTLTCTICNIVDHRPVSCADLQRQKDEAPEERAFQEYLKQHPDSIRCPNVNCQRWISKIDGCNHMTCICRHEFCFLCGSQWVQGGPCGYYRCMNQN